MPGLNALARAAGLASALAAGPAAGDRSGRPRRGAAALRAGEPVPRRGDGERGTTTTTCGRRASAGSGAIWKAVGRRQAKGRAAGRTRRRMRGQSPTAARRNPRPARRLVAPAIPGNWLVGRRAPRRRGTANNARPRDGGQRSKDARGRTCFGTVAASRGGRRNSVGAVAGRRVMRRSRLVERRDRQAGRERRTASACAGRSPGGGAVMP